MTLFGEHTDMAVPIALYAPDSVRNDLLSAMGLPTTAGQIRTGSNEYYAKNESGDVTWYSSSALNNKYTIDNTKIAPALAKILNLGTLNFEDLQGIMTAEEWTESLKKGDISEGFFVIHRRVPRYHAAGTRNVRR